MCYLSMLRGFIVSLGSSRPLVDLVSFSFRCYLLSTQLYHQLQKPFIGPLCKNQKKTGLTKDTQTQRSYIVSYRPWDCVGVVGLDLINGVSEMSEQAHTHIYLDVESDIAKC